MTDAKRSGAAALDMKAAFQRQAIPLMLAVVCVYLARDRFLAVVIGAAWASVQELGPLRWAIALGATCLSFWAVGRYDEVVSRALGTGVAAVPGRRAGMAAIAISQMSGMGLVTGTLVRWRMLADISLAQAARLTLMVTLSFLAGWLVITATASLAFLDRGLPYAAGVAPLATAVLLASLIGLGLCVVRPHRLVKRIGGLPLVPGLAHIMVLTAIDTLAACMVLYVLLPTGSGAGYLAFLPVFLIAFGAGLVLGTPGGIGPFEVTLLTLLPDLAADHLAGAILGYRAVYFALPAAIAAIALAFGPGDADQADDHHQQVQPDRLLARSHRAETLLYRQGEHRLIHAKADGSAILAGSAGHVLAGLFDPIGAHCAMASLLEHLTLAARAEGRRPCIYKIGPRGAARARRHGWVAMAVSHELWLSPADFTLTTPARAGLRRKLRQADAAKVSITSFDPNSDADDLPMAQLSALAVAWQELRGKERGFSMGRFAPDYLAGQRVYIAWQGQVPCAFASFHQGETEWTLDLMRYAGHLPGGTMQSLICAALADAGHAGVSRLSLAAVSLPECGSTATWSAVARRFGKWLGAAPSEGAGLDRFKTGFAPNRTTLYLTAPDWPTLGLAAFELARAIHNPPPLADRSSPATSRSCQTVHEHLDEVAFDNS
jgi:phosphatidylglycerol lysyltransferase